MKETNRRIVISISLSPDILKIVNETISNRSKFLENCIISELCKNSEFKKELKNKFIII